MKNAIGQDALDSKYRFGYSFKNPQLVKKAARAKPYPWFKMIWAPEGPTQKREQLFKEGKLAKYPAVWRRSAKHKTVSKLGVNKDVELQGFDELGQAPGPTTISTVERGFWGSLENILTKTADIIAKREEAKIAEAQAKVAAMMPVRTVTETAQTYWPIVLVLGLGGIGLYMMMRR
ncbi:MAG: hypothetical protein QXT45_06265 [Candidatus Bilamarchaeaceae archaeon]